MLGEDKGTAYPLPRFLGDRYAVPLSLGLVLWENRVRVHLVFADALKADKTVEEWLSISVKYQSRSVSEIDVRNCTKIVRSPGEIS